MNFIGSNIRGGLKVAGHVLQSLRSEPKAEVVDTATLADPNTPKEWTVLAYLEGRDRLSHSVFKALNGMEEIGSTDQVNVVAQATMVPEMGDRVYPGMGSVNTRRYYITQDQDLETVASPVVGEMDEKLELTQKSLEDYLVWGIEKFPAKKYMVMLKRHGLGFAKVGNSVPLSARELRETFENVEQRTGVKPEVIAFDSCDMMQMEVAYELKDRARVMTGSPEPIKAVNYPYQTLLYNLTKYASQQTAETVGATVVKSYEADDPSAIQTALNLEGIKEVAPATAALVKALKDEGVPRDRIYTNLMKASSLEPRESLRLDYNFRDFGGFVKNLESDPQIQSPRVKEAAREVLSSMLEARIAHHVHPRKRDMKKSSGGSAFLPWKRPEAELSQNYGKLAWAKESGWSELLDYVFEEGASPVAEVSSEPSEPKKLSLGQRLGKTALMGYKKYVSPYLLTACPYDPSCSQYAREAVETHGVWEGSKKAFMRVQACSGHGAGGHDPVDPHHHHHHSHEVLPELTLQPPSDPKSPTRKKAEKLLFRAARLAGKLGGGLACALVGAPIGAVLGTVWGAKAGLGSLDTFNQSIREKYGDHKTDSLMRVQAPAAAVGKRVHSAVLSATGSRVLAGVAGGLLGTVAGGLAGGVGGGLFSYKFGSVFGGLYLQNLTKDALGELPTHYRTEQILRHDYN